MKNSVRDFRFVMGAKLWGGWLDNEIVIVSANVINIHFRSVLRCGKFRLIHTKLLPNALNLPKCFWGPFAYPITELPY